MTIALELQQLKKTYPGGVQALRGIDLQVEAGDFYALLGPNGAGKSTTIGTTVWSAKKRTFAAKSILNNSIYGENATNVRVCYLAG